MMTVVPLTKNVSLLHGVTAAGDGDAKAEDKLVKNAMKTVSRY